MNDFGREQVEGDNLNVVSLFSRSMDVVEEKDPMTELLQEAQLEDFDLAQEIPVPQVNRLLVEGHQFPDQSMFILEKQLSSLKSNLSRIKFYLGDLEDLLPR